MATDVIGALTAKRAALYRQEKALLEETDKKMAKIREEIEQVELAIRTVNSVLDGVLCSRCHGIGSVRHCDAAGDMEDIICPACHGTGIKV